MVKACMLEVISETPFWVSSVDIPSTHCGVLGSRSARISLRNCAELLPFICEKGEFVASE